MKRFLGILFIFILSFALIFALSSCGDTDDNSGKKDNDSDDKGSTSKMCPEGEHEYQQWLIEKEAVCNEKGIQYRTCIKCKIKTQKRNYTDSDNHNLIDGVCTRCGFTTSPTDVIFELSEDKSYYILVSVEDKDATEYYVSAMHDGVPVREIAPGAFENCTKLEKVVIPNSVKKIGEAAFKGCYSLKEMTLPFVGMEDSAENSIFGYIFGTVMYPGSVGIEQTGASGKKDYWIPASLSNVTIESGRLYAGCFENCTKLKNITYNGDAKRIYDRAFNGCVMLEYVTMHDNIEKVGDRAFQNCKALKVVPLVEGVEEIGDYCFAGCNFEYLNLPSTLVEVGDCAFTECNLLTSIFIPKNIKVVGDNMFQDCDLLEKVEFDNGVEEIGEASFSGCQKLKEIVFSSSVKTIGKMAFKDCIGLEAVSITCESVLDGAFQGCSSLQSVTISEGLKELKQYAFSYCPMLTELILPASLETFGKNAFAECDSLKVITINENNNSYTQIDGNIYSKDKTTLILYSPGNNQESFVIPDCVTTILGGAFDNAKFLQEVVFPPSMKNIPENLFLQNDTIRSIVIDGGVALIGDNAFAGCSSLTSVTIKNVGNIGEGAFRQCNMLRTIVISGVDTIGKGAFHNCPTVTDVTLENIKLIDENAFAECYSLVNLNIGQGVEVIGTEAFTKCNALVTVTLSSSVTSLGEFAFSDCASLESFNTVYGLTTIGEACFRNCAKLKSFNVSSSVANVNAYAFEGCISLTEFTVSEANGYFFALEGHLVRKNSYELVVFCPGKIEEETTIPEGIVSIGTFAFRNVIKLKKVNFPSSLKVIGNEAFYNTSLSEINLNGIETVGEYAFGSCELLTEITLGPTVKEVMGYAFQDCTGLTKVYIRSSVATMGEGVFHRCPNTVVAYVEHQNAPEGWHEKWNSEGFRVLFNYYFG